MKKVIIKKSRIANPSNIAAEVTMPTYNTRASARAVANKLRAHGVTPTTPVKKVDGWHVSAKHSGGILSLNRNR